MTNEHIVRLGITFISKKDYFRGEKWLRALFKHQVNSSIPNVIFNLTCCSGKATCYSHMIGTKSSLKKPSMTKVCLLDHFVVGTFVIWL